MKKLNITIFFLLITLLLLMVAGLFMRNSLSERVVNGTTLEGQDVSGLTKQELKTSITNKIKELNKNTVNITLNSQSKNYSWEDLGITYQSEDTASKIFSDQQGDIYSQLKMVLERKKKSENYTLQPIFDDKKFDETFKARFPNIVREPIDAKLSIEGKEIKVEGGQTGLVVDKVELKKKVLEANLEGDSSIVVPLKEVQPKITRESIEKMGIREVVSEYKTYFNEDTDGRTNNIKLASKAIDGTILAPGEVFDYNKIVGPRTYERGYKDAHVFSGGKVIDDVGGGICQVSTTLYNAVLYNDLKIVERHNHGLPVSYAPLGRDATVAWGYLNFKFKNNTNHHIYIQAKVEGRKLTMTLFGTKQGKEVYVESKEVDRIEPPVRKISDPSLEVGQTVVEKAGVYGYKSETWKITRQNGKVIKKELLSKDYYKPSEKVLRVGTKEPEVKAENQIESPEGM